jgi:prevent-host-death family protein
VFSLYGPYGFRQEVRMSGSTIGAEEARQTLPALLDRAAEGETTIISRRGRPCAAVVPLSAVPPAARAPSLNDLRGTGRGLWGDDPAATIAAGRAEW